MSAITYVLVAGLVLGTQDRYVGFLRLTSILILFFFVLFLKDLLRNN